MNNRKQKRVTWIIISAAIMVVIGGIIFLSLNTDTTAVTAVNDGYDRYRDSLTNAKKAFDDGAALFIDVRSTGEFTASHIPGAISIPLGEIEGNEPVVDKGALIYTYCT